MIMVLSVKVKSCVSSHSAQTHSHTCSLTDLQSLKQLVMGSVYRVCRRSSQPLWDRLSVGGALLLSEHDLVYPKGSRIYGDVQQPIGSFLNILHMQSLSACGQCLHHHQTYGWPYCPVSRQGLRMVISSLLRKGSKCDRLLFHHQYSFDTPKGLHFRHLHPRQLDMSHPLLWGVKIRDL